MLPGTDPYAADLRRLRGWNVSSWRHGDRQVAARRANERLARLASRHDGISRPAVPDIGPHGLVDQLQVLIADARQAGATEPELAEILGELHTALGLRPR